MSRGDKGPRGLGAWPRAHGILPVTLNAGAGLCGAGRDAQSLGSVPKGPSAPIGQFPVRGPRDPAPPTKGTEHCHSTGSNRVSGESQGVSVAGLEAKEQLAQGVSWGTLGWSLSCLKGNDRQGASRGRPGGGHPGGEDS